jgi:hypothetical protein
MTINFSNGYIRLIFLKIGETKGIGREIVMRY